MTFKQILRKAENGVKTNLVVMNRKELGQLKRAYRKFKSDVESLKEKGNFDLSMEDDYDRTCKIIEYCFDNAIILK